MQIIKGIQHALKKKVQQGHAVGHRVTWMRIGVEQGCGGVVRG